MAFGDFTVTRASTKNVLGSAGLYVSVANNVPAFEFNTDGSYRGLLVEPGATNLFNRSQEFGDAYWGKVSAVVTDNTDIAPDGTLTADTIDAAAGRVQVAISVTSGTVYTASVFAKQKGGSIFQIILIQGTNPSATFNLATGVVSATAGGGTGTITLAPNGYYRCTMTFTASATASVDIRMIQNANNIIAWQAQLETGSVATSPIVTTAGTASRVADVVSLTGASSLIGQTEGTLYAEVDTRVTGGASLDKRIFSLSDGTTGLLIELSKTITDELKARVVNTTEQASIVTATNRTGVFKLALAYAVNDIAFYVNGVQIGTDALATIPACSAINIGSRVDVNAGTFFNDRIRSVALFPTRIPNATLVSLTTP